MHPAGTLLLLLLLLLLSVAVHSATALYSPKDGVVLATDATFNALVLQSNRPSIVEFFAPWCACLLPPLPSPPLPYRLLFPFARLLNFFRISFLPLSAIGWRP